ncbi:universal stress protein [Gramella sp. MAR_2010_147]|uniref:universal stress protein n=1 Tax=Gramella sp. MAR_2010_147 TaxID=1250205 RepID=UPI000879F541|nr:universal stress protein [Gramella sp. MAR_2010_147]SDS66762.1 Nucleotide-binding universal stress protein, UspA family [Gramella sp. MAR_2010_147]
MRTIEKILVALDLTSTDEELIRYASFLADKLQPKKVYFVHNIKKYEISELFKEQLKDLDLEKMISDELDEKVANHFDAKTDSEVLISEDPYTESLINYVVHKYSIDLVIVGNKSRKKGTGVISEKLMRLLKCDILSVPKNASQRIDKIWAGTDFSRESIKSLQRASYLANNTGAEITAINIYNVPIQFTPYLEKEEMLPKIEKHTREKFEKFLHRNKITDCEIKIIRGREASVAAKLSTESENAGADLVIVADKGGNVFSSLLVGSVTDELFSRSLKIPLWVTK